MQAKDLMSRDLITIDKDEPLLQALDLMARHSVSKLVVLEKGRLAGVVTDGDIADELGARKNARVSINHIHVSTAVRRETPTAHPDATLYDLLAILLDDDAGIIPIVHDDMCIGVVTEADLLAHVDDTTPLADFMVTEVITVTADDRLVHARRLMLDNHIERLPVLEGSRVVGVLGERDVASALARLKTSTPDRNQAAALQRLKVGDAFTPQVVTAERTLPARDAARQMRSDDLGCLPVVHDGKINGIVTRSDLLRLIKS